MNKVILISASSEIKGFLRALQKYIVSAFNSLIDHEVLDRKVYKSAKEFIPYTEDLIGKTRDYIDKNL